MNAAIQRAADERRRPNVAAAHALAEKLRVTDEPLTAAERIALAWLLHTVTDRVDSRPRDSFDERHAWATIASSFDVRMTLLRDTHGTGGVL